MTPVSLKVVQVPSQSEAQILARGFNCAVDEIRPDSLTGVDIEALARSACAALGLKSEAGSVTVEVTFYRRGTFNVLYRHHFTGGVDVDVLARIPTLAFREHGGASVSSTVANMLFAQHVCDIPVPRIIAWNDGSTSTSGSPDQQEQVPYIITDLVQDAYEVWPAWLHEPLERQERIFESFARTQAVFLRPLPIGEFPLSSIGSLSLKRLGGTTGASAKDYVLEPLTVRHKYALAPFHRPRNPVIRLRSLVLRDVWLELLALHSSGCFASTSPEGQVVLNWEFEDRDPILAPVTDFLGVVDDLRALVERTLDALDRRPAFLQPCLVRTDYALRNVLLDPNTATLETKACIDFDDVQICPLVLAHIFPQDLLEFEEWSLSPDDPYFTQEGGFSEFPPDEYGPEDLSTDDEERLASNERIRYTAYRTIYLAALEQADPRIAEDGWWELHKDARKVHELLVGGTHIWWLKREWLRLRRGDSVPATT